MDRVALGMKAQPRAQTKENTFKIVGHNNEHAGGSISETNHEIPRCVTFSSRKYTDFGL